jgi:hypothetical protein
MFDDDSDLILHRKGIIFGGTKKVHFVAVHNLQKTLCGFHIIEKDEKIRLIDGQKLTDTNCELCRGLVEKAAKTGVVKIARIQPKEEKNVCVDAV